MPSQKPSPQPTPVTRLQTLLPHLAIFLSPTGTPCTRIPQGPFRLRTLPLGSLEMEQWLLVIAEEKLGLTPTTTQIRQALRPSIATAHFCNVPTRPTPLRFHRTENTLLLDLGDRSNVVTINATGWQVVEDHETAWLSPASQCPLPIPERTEASLAEMLATALTLTHADSKQLSAWIADACHQSPYPRQPLVLTGPARHQAAHLLRDLIDPSVTPFQNPARAHLQSEIKERHLLIFPEVSRLTDSLRRLTQPVIYTNDGDIKCAHAPLTLNIAKCISPRMNQLLGALCNCLSQPHRITKVAASYAVRTPQLHMIQRVAEDDEIRQLIHSP